jgi:hypothetical protein
VTPHRWSWRTFSAALALLSGLVGVWGLAVPLLGAPDEPAHVLRAAGVVRGQLTGLPGLPTAVSVPPAVAEAQTYAGCFVFRPEVDASCAPALAVDRGEPDVEARTQAGRYPPAWYALTGLPTLVWQDLAVVHAVRAVSGALVAGLLAAAATLALASGRPLLRLAVGAAATPMALFLGGSANPSGPEAAAGLLLWVAGTLVVLDGPRRSPLWCAGVAAVVLALLRPVSPLWVAVAGVVLLLLAGRRVPALVRSRGVQLVAGAAVLAALVQTAFVVGLGSLQLYGSGRELPLSERLAGSLGRTDERARQMVGWFGWLEVPAPDWVVGAWAVVVAVVVLAGLLLGRWGQRLLVLLLVAAVVAVPVALEAPSVATVGFYWQGRYTLPLAAGALVVAAAVARRSPPRWCLAVLLAVVAAAQVGALIVALGRWTDGVGQPLDLLDPAWSPPLPPVALVAAYAVLAVGWCALLALGRAGQPVQAVVRSS